MRHVVTSLLLASLACGGSETNAEGPSGVSRQENSDPPVIDLGGSEEPVPEAENPPTQVDDGSWSGVLACTYRISHGWGNVYECTLVDRIDGTAPPGPIGLHLTMDHVTRLSATDTWKIEDFVGRFYPSDRPYGPPSGYRDAAGVYWTLVVDQ